MICIKSFIQEKVNFLDTAKTSNTASGLEEAILTDMDVMSRYFLDKDLTIHFQKRIAVRLNQMLKDYGVEIQISH